MLRQHRTILALRLKHRSGSCGTASALPKCSIMSGCGTRIVLRGQKPLALCDRCPCFGSLHPPLAALTFAASSIICAFGLASAAPRSPYRHLELCGIALKQSNPTPWNSHCARRHVALPQIPSRPIGQGLGTVKTVPYRTNYNGQHTLKQSVGRGDPTLPKARNSTLLKNRNLPYPHNKGNTQNMANTSGRRKGKTY